MRNFRCFREEQTARLAPLTLLVGENSTGKTSFLAMLRALWDAMYQTSVPDFKEEPYDLGSFDEIAYHQGGRGGRADTFEAGFDFTPRHKKGTANRVDGSRFEVTFGRIGTIPIPVRRYLASGGAWIEEYLEQVQPMQLRFGTPKGAWQLQEGIDRSPFLGSGRHLMLSFFVALRHFWGTVENRESRAWLIRLQGSKLPAEEDWEMIERLAYTPEMRGSPYSEPRPYADQRPYASAPVRSKPLRTYDPWHSTQDSEGDYVPMYLASLYSEDKTKWNAEARARKIRQRCGSFDEIAVRQLGKNETGTFSDPGQKIREGAKGPHRNLMDVGYGVSQVLPVITEMLRRDAPPTFLLQQPEVHLHPSAQAALGSLFCQVAGPQRQLVVETHSDHLLDRVRMDVRDGTTGLRPEDVSILFFERGDLDVRIHSLRLDKEGNVLDAPQSYRQFFMEETQRSLRL